MKEANEAWALVLAAGEGSRLRSLTTISEGVAVPKQFCSLQGGPSLLDDAIRRAEAIAPRQRICTIVAHQHRRWWEGALQALPTSNVIVQPQNRGTGNGILLPLLHIIEKDPQARIVLLPSDQYVRDEAVLASALQRAVTRLRLRPDEIVLLGLEPEEVDPELGYIVPAGWRDLGAHGVRQFVEKPSSAAAEALIRRGALWNAFIIAARAQTLLSLYLTRYPDLVARMRAAIVEDAATSRPAAITALYENLPDVDFSRHILEGAESALRVLATPACGWSDLGTPERVARTLHRASDRTREKEKDDVYSLSAHLNLARQHLLLQAAI